MANRRVAAGPRSAFREALSFRMGADGELTQRAYRADCRRWPSRQGQQARRQAEADRRHARRRARRTEAARGASSPSAHDVARRRVGDRHGHHVDARRRRLARAQRSGTPARTRGSRSRDGAPDHALHGRPVQGVGSERSAGQLDHRARDPRQGRRAHRSRARGPAGDPGDADGHDGHRVHEPRPV